MAHIIEPVVVGAEDFGGSRLYQIVGFVTQRQGAGANAGAKEPRTVALG
jgi:hypothetical protein